MLAGVFHVSLATHEPVVMVALSVAPVASCLGLGIAAYRRSILSAAIGGAVIGVGMGAMHCFALWAQEAPIRWLIDFVALSIALGIIFAFPALVVWQRHSSSKTRVAAAALLSIGILSHELFAITTLAAVRDPMQMIDPSLEWTILPLRSRSRSRR
jgi:NO-binding membrane sensor protein with MHYT domain